MTRRLAPGGPLSELETRVLQLAADGHTIAAIATTLDSSVPAVQDARHRMLGKLGAQSIAHAVLLACQAGILDGRPRRHGDHAGYAAHEYRGEDPCEACIEGEKAYRAERRAARRAAKTNPSKLLAS